MKSFTQLCPLLLFAKGQSALDTRPVSVSDERFQIKQYVSLAPPIAAALSDLAVPESVLQSNIMGAAMTGDPGENQSYLHWISRLDALVDFTAWLLTVHVFQGDELFAVPNSAKTLDFAKMWSGLREFFKIINVAYIGRDNDCIPASKHLSGVEARAHAELLRHVAHLLLVFVTQQSSPAASSSLVFKLVIQDVLNDSFLKVAVVVMLGLGYHPGSVDDSAAALRSKNASNVRPFLPHPESNDKFSIFLPSTFHRFVEVIMREAGATAATLDGILAELIPIAACPDRLVTAGLEFHKIFEAALKSLKVNASNVSAKLSSVLEKASKDLISGVIDMIVGSSGTVVMIKVLDPAVVLSSIRIALTIRDLHVCASVRTSGASGGSDFLIESLLLSHAPQVVEFCRRHDDFCAQCILDFSRAKPVATNDIGTSDWDATVTSIVRLLDGACTGFNAMGGSALVTPSASSSLEAGMAAIFVIVEKTLNLLSATTDVSGTTNTQAIDRVFAWGATNVPLLYAHASPLLEQVLLFKGLSGGAGGSVVHETASGQRLCSSVSKHISSILCDPKASSNIVCKALQFVPYLLEGTTVSAPVRAGSTVGATTATYRKQVRDAHIRVHCKHVHL
jgi:hypothetical protein